MLDIFLPHSQQFAVAINFHAILTSGCKVDGFRIQCGPEKFNYEIDVTKMFQKSIDQIYQKPVKSNVFPLFFFCTIPFFFALFENIIYKFISSRRAVFLGWAILHYCAVA